MIWVLAILASLTAALFIARPMLTPNIEDIGSTDKDIALYKDQLKEVDADLARGVLNESEAEAARTEVGRRILNADKNRTSRTRQSDPKANRIIASLVGLFVLVGSIGLYAATGRPDLPDQPLKDRLATAKAERDNRPSQASMEEKITAVEVEAPQDYLELVTNLRETVEARPNDIEGQRLLALHEGRLGNFVAAHTAQARVIELMEEKVTAKEHIDLAELMIFATQGYVSPEAEGALSNALQLDPRDPRGRYYSGLSMAQGGRPDVAFRLWQGLLEEGPQDAPWIEPIKSQISDLARAAGIALDDINVPGPTADQIEEAGNMSEEDRLEMIQGMVSGLAERLATEGGTPSEWARLIRALGVLGETGRANAIWQEAQETFKTSEEALDLLREAARSAEILQ